MYLDMEGLKYQYAEPAHTERMPYDPHDLFKRYLYSYVNRVRSSHWLTRECERNAEVMRLHNSLRPDIHTIAPEIVGKQLTSKTRSKRSKCICAKWIAATNRPWKRSRTAGRCPADPASAKPFVVAPPRQGLMNLRST